MFNLFKKKDITENTVINKEQFLDELSKSGTPSKWISENKERMPNMTVSAFVELQIKLVIELAEFVQKK